MQRPHSNSKRSVDVDPSGPPRLARLHGHVAVKPPASSKPASGAGLYVMRRWARAGSSEVRNGPGWQKRQGESHNKSKGESKSEPTRALIRKSADKRGGRMVRGQWRRMEALWG